MFGKHDKGRTPLDERWGERELFFWTAFKWVQLVVAVALAVNLVAGLIVGSDPLLGWFLISK